MMVSMTGFASKSLALTQPDGTKVNISMTLKSLNSKFFEATCKLPYALTNMETTLIKIFKSNLKRGHIFFTAHMSNQNALKTTITPSLPIIQGYTKAATIIKEQCGVEGSLTISDLMHLPNIFSVEEQEMDEKFKQLFLQTVQELVTELTTVRTKEGNELEKDIRGRTKTLAQEIAIIEELSKQSTEQRKKKISDLLAQIDHTNESLSEAKQAVLYTEIDKMDISEEIVRFKSHLEVLSTELTSDRSEKGKKMDFTLQELMREINTISAKALDASISGHAITVKVEVEKIREQIQNIV